MRGLAILLTLLALPASAEPVPGGLDALTRFRAGAGVAQVRGAPQLQVAAERHAMDMARSGAFSHTGSDGTSVADRVQHAGYGYCFVAENIAKGQRDLAAVMAAWAKSPGHRQNMLDPRATEAAIARAPGNIWVMVLARPGC